MQASSCPEGGARYFYVLTLLAVLTVLRDFAAAEGRLGIDLRAVFLLVSL